MRPLLTNIATLTGHKQGVYALAKGLEANRFYTSGSDGQVAEWSTETPGEAIGIARLTGPCWAMTTVPQSGLLVLGQNQEGIHVIHTETRSQLGSLALGGASIYSLLTLPEGLVAVGDGDGKLKIIDVEALVVLADVQVSSQAIRTLCIIDAHHLAAAGSDGHIHILNLPSLVETRAWAANVPTVMSLRLLPGNILASAGRDARIKTWDLQDPYPTLLQDVPAHHYSVYDLALHPGGELLLSASMDKTLKIWNASTLQLLRVQDKARRNGHNASVNRCLWLSPTHAVSCSDDRTAILWELTMED
jgi:WD40 repeat protein